MRAPTHVRVAKEIHEIANALSDRCSRDEAPDRAHAARLHELANLIRFIEIGNRNLKRELASLRGGVPQRALGSFDRAETTPADSIRRREVSQVKP